MSQKNIIVAILFLAIGFGAGYYAANTNQESLQGLTLTDNRGEIDLGISRSSETNNGADEENYIEVEGRASEFDGVDTPDFDSNIREWVSVGSGLEDDGPRKVLVMVTAPEKGCEESTNELLQYAEDRYARVYDRVTGEYREILISNPEEKSIDDVPVFIQILLGRSACTYEELTNKGLYELKMNGDDLAKEAIKRTEDNYNITFKISDESRENNEEQTKNDRPECPEGWEPLSNTIANKLIDPQTNQSFDSWNKVMCIEEDTSWEPFPTNLRIQWFKANTNFNEPTENQGGPRTLRISN